MNTSEPKLYLRCHSIYDAIDINKSWPFFLIFLLTEALPSCPEALRSFELVWGIVICYQQGSMKSRHRKNKSLVNEHSRSNPYAHHRSFSFNRYIQKNSINIHNHCLQNEHIANQSLTLPVSAEFNREHKTNKKMAPKEGSQQLNKQKKSIKSKDKDSICRKIKEKNKLQREKNSNDRGEKSNKKGSKELLKNRQSLEKVKIDTSGERRYKNSQEKKALISERPKAEKPKNEKLKSNTKRRNNNQQEIASNWEEVIQSYGEHLSLEEISEMKEFKWIYFLGKIKNRRVQKGVESKLKKPLSARQTHNENVERKEDKDLMLRDNDEEELTSRKVDTADQFYRYQIGDHIAYRYEIIESVNKGSFGEVVKVLDHKSKEQLALKIVKKSQEIVQQTYIEVAILTHIKEKDKSDVSGIVRIKDFTIFRNHICIVFELLEGNLYELLQSTNYNGLSEEVIRIFAVQILNSLAFLQQERIIHCDIKPENIVMRSWGKSRVKLIDFGSSCFSGQQMFEYLQSRYYRAPEIMLRKPYSYEIDMWSFGCLLIELKIGQPVFAGATNTQQLMYICNSIGYPIPSDGRYCKQFLDCEQFREIIAESYLEEYHYMVANKLELSSHPYFSECKYIKNCMKTIRERLQSSKGYSKEDPNFLKFIEKILVWEPQKRLRPQEALQDNWILKGLPTQIKQFYTIFNSTQYQKKSKGKSKQSKQSKSKNSSKRSNDKAKAKQSSRRQCHISEMRSRDYNAQPKLLFNNKIITGHVLQK